MRANNRNELWARVLIDELARAGIRDLVIAPGSRSAPLVLAARSDARLRTWIQIDERSAAFLALGVAKASGTPAAVVTTSGTAVANLFPAVVEAAQSETPLLLLTADRPPRLRGADANQTIDQIGIFGGYARLFVDLSPADVSEAALRHLRSVACRAVAAAVGDPGGPVHLNLSFDLPLEPTPAPGDLPDALAEGRTPGSGGRASARPWTRVSRSRSAPPPEGVTAVEDALRNARRPLLVGGIVPRPWEVGPALRRAAVALRLPLLADPLSGARYPTGRQDAEPPSGPGGDAAPGRLVDMGGYDLALQDLRVAERLAPDLVIRVGSAPTSSILHEWLGRLDGAEQVVVDPGGRWKDHAGTATHMVKADPEAFLRALAAVAGGEAGRDPEWLPSWERVRDRVAAEVAGGAMHPPFEGALVAEVGRAVPAGDLLFVSGSLSVREIDTFLPHRDAPLLVIGNRGASGIDGIVSTAAGAAIATGRRVVAVVGDLALLHDSNGLATLRDPAVRVALVVVNNDGGGIFHLLPIREHEPSFTPCFVTPHGRDLSHLAALHDLPFERVEGRFDPARPAPGGNAAGIGAVRAGLGKILAREGSGILEIRTDPEENRRRRAEAAHAIASAAGDALTREGG